MGGIPTGCFLGTQQLNRWLWINYMADLFLIRLDRAPSQYPKRRLSVRSRNVSKPRDLYLELSDRLEIWQALGQQCCRCACKISKRYDNLKYQSRGFETLRDLTKRRLFGYWDGTRLPSRGIHFTAILMTSPIDIYNVSCTFTNISTC